MNLIKPSFEIISPLNGEKMLEQIELAARTCYQSEGKIEKIEVPYTDGIHAVVVGYYLQEATSARKLISKLIANGHEAMLEFSGNITVRFICDRGVSHELVRHRVASFAQESTRYCNYGKDEYIKFIIPNWTGLPEGVVEDREVLNMWMNGEFDDYTPTESEGVWLYAMENAESAYNFLVNVADNKWTPQEARSVLPNSLKTEINISTNIREWRHIFKLRCAKTAHPSMQELMIPLLHEFQQKIPIIFDDIIF